MESPHRVLFNLCFVFVALKCPLGGAVAFPPFSIFLAMKMRGLIFCFGKPHDLPEEGIAPEH